MLNILIVTRHEFYAEKKERVGGEMRVGGWG